MGQQWAAWIVALGIASALGCHHEVRAPMLGFGPIRPGDAVVLADALRVAGAAAYPPMRTDAVHGRFSVRAHADPLRQTSFVVQCSRDGFVVVHPEGGAVVRVGDAFELSPELREEYMAFALALERGVPEGP